LFAVDAVAQTAAPWWCVSLMGDELMGDDLTKDDLEERRPDE
jgi:hypothetical protein